jgi:two-component system cell cycle sensor histidine kinase/response regulator CckA
MADDRDQTRDSGAVDARDVLRAIVEGTTDAVFVKDLQGRYVSFNRAAGVLAGLAPESVIGLDDAAIFQPDDAHAIMEADRAVLSGGVTRTYEERLTMPDGRRRTFTSTKGPIVDANGAITGIFGLSRDVTDRTDAEDRLRHSEARFRSLIQNSSDITTILSDDGTVRYESPAFYRLFGYAEGDIIGRNAFELVHPDDRERTIDTFRRAIAERHTEAQVEFRFRKPDGSYVTLEAVGRNRLDDPEIAGVVVNSRDVSERRRLEDELRQAQKMEAIGRLAGGVAHDFNNLLTVIDGYSDLVLSRADLSDALRRPIQEIRKAGERAAQLTSQLLAFGRRRVFLATALDLNNTVLNLTGMLRRLIGENIRLETHLSANLGLIKVDAGQLDQVLMNLALNARDAMPDGGTLTIETRGARGEPHVSLIVRDTGCGMDAETQAHVFEPFFTTKEPGRGTGLGLATVYGIVTQHGGAICADSAPGEGTAFVIAFPQAAAPTDERVEPPASPMTAHGHETILLVEDEVMVRDFARDVLISRGYRVLAAPSAEEALAQFDRHVDPIHLLLTDVVMPGMNGRALAEQLTLMRPDLKVIFTSGYNDDAALGRGTRWEGTLFLQKPFSPEALGRLVRQVLDAGPDRRHPRA